MPGTVLDLIGSSHKFSSMGDFIGQLETYVKADTNSISVPGPCPVSDDVQQQILKMQLGIEVEELDHPRNKKLGDGGFGSVERAVYVDGRGVRHNVAVKYANGLERSKAQEALRNELQVFDTVGYHPNVICCFGGNLGRQNVASVGRDCFIVLELMCRNLADFLRSPEFRLCSYQTSLKICLGIAKGMQHLHSKHIIHYDLKPQNILLDDDLNAKIADFGESKLRCTRTVTADHRGTQNYMAPEIQMARYFNKLRGTKKADIFSFGVVLWECVTAQRPPSPEDALMGRMGTTSMGKTRDEMVRIGGSLLTVSKDCPGPIVDLITRCTNLLIDDRPTSAEIQDELAAMLKEPWVNNPIWPEESRVVQKGCLPWGQAGQRLACPHDMRIDLDMLTSRILLSADELSKKGLDIQDSPFSVIEEALYIDKTDTKHKVLVKFAKDPGLWRCFKDELDMWAQIPSPPHCNVLNCFGGKVGFSDGDDEAPLLAHDVFVVEEQAEMTLDYLIHKEYSISVFMEPVNISRLLDGSRLLDILQDITMGLGHLHNNGIIHYFLNPRNIMIDREGHAKVGGFHLSSVRIPQHHASDCDDISIDYDFPFAYMAPELILSNYDQAVSITDKVDIYSLGVVMWEAVTLERPPGKGDMSPFVTYTAAYSTTSSKGRFPLDDAVPKDLRSLIEDCLKFDAEERPSCEAIQRRLADARGGKSWKLLPDNYELPPALSDTAIYLPHMYYPAVLNGLNKRRFVGLSVVAENGNCKSSTSDGSRQPCSTGERQVEKQQQEIVPKCSGEAEDRGFSAVGDFFAKTFCWCAFPSDVKHQ